MTYEVKFSKLSDVRPSKTYIGMLLNDQTKEVKKIIALHDLDSQQDGKQRRPLPFTITIQRLLQRFGQKKYAFLVLGSSGEVIKSNQSLYSVVQI